MVRHRDDASYVHWAETLHPEAAVEAIDPRFRNSGANPWAVVYNDTISVLTEDEQSIPVAVQVVSVDEEQPATSTLTQEPGGSPSSPHHHEDAHQTGRPTRLQPWKKSNFIDLLIGMILSIVGVAITFKVELIATLLYALAGGFYYLATEVFTSTPMALLKAIFLFLSSIMMVVDSILLAVSVLLTEVVSGIAGLLCTIFGGPTSGKEWHQFIRRFCHLTRWAFRGWLKLNWKPERIFPISIDENDVAPFHSDEHAMNGENPPYSDHEGNDTFQDTPPQDTAAAVVQELPAIPVEHVIVEEGGPRTKVT